MLLRRTIAFCLLLAVAAATTATYALASVHDLSVTRAPIAGSGAAVLHVAYEVDATRPTRVAALRLRLATPARGAVAATLDGGATWLECDARGAVLRCPTQTAAVHVQDAAALAIAPAL